MSGPRMTGSTSVEECLVKKLSWAVLEYLAAGSVLACGRGATEPSAPGPAALQISVTTQVYGCCWSFDFVVRVDGGADRPISENGNLVIDPIAAGGHTVTLVTNYPWVGFSGCRVGGRQVGTATVSVTVPAGRIGRVNFDVFCSP